MVLVLVLGDEEGVVGGGGGLCMEQSPLAIGEVEGLAGGHA